MADADRYFWTGKPMPSPLKEPPGPLNADAWTILFTVAQQRRIVDEFAALNGCVVYHPTGTAFWNLSSRAESGLPLVNFVQHNFNTVRLDGRLSLPADNTARELVKIDL